MLAPKAVRQPAHGALNRGSEPAWRGHIVGASDFHKILGVERRRCERSGRRFVLMLLDWTNLLNGGTPADLGQKVIQKLVQSIRETDVTGWYEEESVFGVIFTELGEAPNQAVASALLTRVTQALTSTLGIDQIHKVGLSFHVFPDDAHATGGSGSSQWPMDTQESRHSLTKGVKRAIDIGGSLILIIAGAPLLAAIAVAVKLTSSGPVLFRQLRIGSNGQPFTFLKFRSMINGNSSKIHQDFVTQLIKGEIKGTTEFKLTADPRVTRIGRVLRKTSLDELPQLFNVLKGDMSLVGPRPPVPYEYENYRAWHRRRLNEAKPGITGLWQVKGRSRVGFDDMVRLDLRYARAWSLWLDLKILFETPRAVVSGNGAR